MGICGDASVDVPVAGGLARPAGPGEAVTEVSDVCWVRVGWAAELIELDRERGTDRDRKELARERVIPGEGDEGINTELVTDVSDTMRSVRRFGLT